MSELDNSALLNLKRILADEDISKSLLYNGKKPGYIALGTDGSLTLGETSYGWWNRFIGCQKVLSFSDLVTHLINFMAGGKNRNDFALDGLYQDFINFTLKLENKNRMVDILLTSYLFGYKEIQKAGGTPSPKTLVQAVSSEIRDLDGVAVLTANGPVILRKDITFHRV